MLQAKTKIAPFNSNPLGVTAWMEFGGDFVG